MMCIFCREFLPNFDKAKWNFDTCFENYTILLTKMLHAKHFILFHCSLKLLYR